MQIRKAERKQAKMRIGISSPSGGGKTFSALLLAKGLVWDWSKVGVIDTENGSADLYSHLGEFNVITLEAPFSPERYAQAISALEEAGMEAIVIDSASHEWDGTGGCLEINEQLAQTKFRWNTWSAWSVTNERHKEFVNAVIQSKCHVITTARSKTETIQTEDKKIKKVGMKDIQRDGFEYEMTIMFNLDRDRHTAIASKDRTGLFMDSDPFVITEDTGKAISEWNASGAKNPEFEKDEEELEIVISIKEAKDVSQLGKIYESVKSKAERLGNARYVRITELVKERKAELEDVDLSEQHF